MKKIMLLVLGLTVCAAPLRAQVKAAGAPDACPCTDFRFVAKTEKAKAVADFWDARRKYKIAAGVGGFAVLFAEMAGRPTSALNDAQNALGQAEDDLYRARKRAVELGGIVVSGDDADAPVTVKLTKGVDYVFQGAP